MATRDALEQALGSGQLLSLTNRAVKADQNLNAAQADIQVRNLEHDVALAGNAKVAADANQNAITQTAAITNQIIQKQKELEEADSGNKAYRALYAIPLLNMIPMAIDSNIETKREEIAQLQETLTTMNAATTTQDNNLTLQQKATELQKAVSTEQYIRAFQEKQNANSEIAGADQNFKFLQSRLGVETEKLRQAQITQSMGLAARQEARAVQENAARQRLLILQGDQAQAELDSFKQNKEQVANVIDSFNKSTGATLDEATFRALPTDKQNFIVQSQTGLLRDGEDMYAMWRAQGFTDDSINLIPTGMRDQIRSRINYANKVERDYYTSQSATDPAGIRVRDQLQMQFGEVDPKTGAPTGRVDFNKVNANYQETTSMDIADSAGQSFMMNQDSNTSREVVQTMTNQNKLPKTFTDLVVETATTSLGLGNTESNTVSTLTEVVEKALAEQKARSSELGISALAPLMGSYQSPTLYGMSSETVNIPLTDSFGNINRVNLKQLVRGTKAQLSSRSNATAISGNASSFQILENYRNQQNGLNTNVNSARDSNERAITADQNSNANALDNLNQ